MPTVYDRTTLKPVELDPTAQAKGLVDGSLTLDANDASPLWLKKADGSTFQAPDRTKALQALADHPTAYSLLSPDEELKAQTAKEEEAKGVMGSVVEGAKSFGNQALFGIPGAIEDASMTPEEKAKREAQEEYHSTARYLTGAAGFGTSMLVGGEIFDPIAKAGAAVADGVLPAAKLAESGLATKLASTAVDMATQGAIASSPNAFIQATVGNDQKGAAETLAWGLGAGAILGTVGEGLAQGAKGIAGKIGDAAQSLYDNPDVNEAVNDFANNRALKAVGAERGQLNKLSDDRPGQLADYAFDNGLIKPGMSRGEIGDAIDVAKQAEGGKLGDIINSLDKHIVQGTSTEDLVQHAIKPGALADAISQSLDSPELRMPMNADQKAALDKIVESAQMLPTTKVNGQEVVKFEDAQDFISGLNKRFRPAIDKVANEGGAKGLSVLTPLDEMKSAAYQVGRNFINDAADKVAVAAEDPALNGALAKAKANYSKLSQLEQFASTVDRQAAGNRLVGITDFMHMGRGPLASLSAGAGGALGAAVGGLPGMAIGSGIGKAMGAGLDLLAKHWLEDKGLVYVSAIAKKAAQQGPEAFTAALASEQGLRLQATLKGVKSTIQAMATRSTILAHPPTNPMNNLLGNTQGLSKEQAYSKLSQRLTDLGSNPDAAIKAVSQFAAPISHASPDLGSAYGTQMLTAIKYLYDALPKQSAPANPFAPAIKNIATPQQRRDFNDKAEIVSNPMAALNHVQKGTLSDAHLDALKSVYPATYQKLRDEVLNVASSTKIKLPFQERQSIAKFLGQPLDGTQSPDSVRLAQSLHAGTGSQSGQQANPQPALSRLEFSKDTSMASQFSAKEND